MNYVEACAGDYLLSFRIFTRLSRLPTLLSRDLYIRLI